MTGEEVPNSEIVNGFDLGDGEYVVVTRDELKGVAPGKSETIEISDFVDLAEIDPIHFRQTYYLAPRGKGADRAYALLRQACDEAGKVGIATMVLRDKEHLVAVRPGADVLIIETMYFADEIRKPARGTGHAAAGRRASGTGNSTSPSSSSSPSRSSGNRSDTTTPTGTGSMELIERKREGKSVVFEEERPKSNVIDLMAALEASVASMGGQEKGREAAPAPPAPGARGAAAGRGRRGRDGGPGRAEQGRPGQPGGRSRPRRPVEDVQARADRRDHGRRPRRSAAHGRFPSNLPPAGLSRGRLSGPR